MGKYCKAIGIDGLYDGALPVPESNKGYRAFEHILPLFLMLSSNGRVLSDLLMIHSDKVMRTALKIPRMPTEDAY